MSPKCVLCNRTQKLNKNKYTRILSAAVEYNIKQEFKRKNSSSLLINLVNKQVHSQCFRKYSHHTYSSENNQLPAEHQQNYSSRLPLVDRTNNQLPSSLEQITSTINPSSQQSATYEDFLLNNSDRTLWLTDSSSTNNFQGKNKPSFNDDDDDDDDDTLDLKQDFLHSIAPDNKVRANISNNGESFNDVYTLHSEQDFLNSASHDVEMYSNHSHNEQLFNDDTLDLEQDFLHSTAHDDNLHLNIENNGESFKDVYTLHLEQDFIDPISYDVNMHSNIHHNEHSFDDNTPDLEQDFLHSTSPDNGMRSNISHNGQSFDQDILDSEQDSHNTWNFIDAKFSSTFGSSSTKSPHNEPLSVKQKHKETSSTTNISSCLRSRYSNNSRKQNINDTQYVVDDRTKSSLYYDSFSELCGWLEDLLCNGFLVSLVVVKEKYEEILQSRNESVTEGIIRTASIRDRLQTKFRDQILFTKVNNRQGIFISWNDLTTITQSTLSNSSTLDYDYSFQSNVIYKDRQYADTETQSKVLFQAIELLRESISENMHYLKQVHENHKSLAEFTTGLFWDCIPILVKNFIGLLTTNDDHFQNFKNNFEYSNLFNKDMYKSDEKSLKISSMGYDIINTRYSSYSTPKHLLLGNELYHHVRSSHLINVMNRFGHTCSYETIVRLQKTVADEVSKLSSSDLPPTVQQQHSFAITVADNFDLNIGTLRGENSIHILNRIIIQTPANDELNFDLRECLNDLCASVVAALDDSNLAFLFNSNTTNPIITPTSNTPSSPSSYVHVENNSYRDMLLAYALMKRVFDTNNIFEKVIDNKIEINIPLLSGFFAIYLPNVHRPLSKITFLPPINENPSSLSTSESCLRLTKASLIDSGFEREAVVVVDEKIYSNCIKVKRLNQTDNKLIFLYPGDFHIMKNYMVVIWDVLDGSGIEDVLAFIYKGAAHRSIMNVHNFNYSLRCCKLVYTALAEIFCNSFLKTLSTPTTTTNIIMNLKEILKRIPSDYVITDKKQEWFSILINEIESMKLSDILDQWAAEQSRLNEAFKFWYFIFRKLIEPLLRLYMSIRLSNFDERNAALSSMAPIFFATNHRNYARLSVQHLLDLQSCSVYLRERLERCFTVNRTNRPFSAIALDQAIECSINKYGKGRGGISGKLKPESIESWCKSFAFRSMLSSITNEIACIERTNNTIDAHMECSMVRMAQDNKDLLTITKVLQEENLFDQNNVHVRKIMNGKIIHQKIIENIVSMYDNGLERMHLFIQERYIDQLINIDHCLSAMTRYKLSESYAFNDQKRLKKKINTNNSGAKLMQSANDTIKDIISMTYSRELNLNSIFAHEFTPAPLSLCDNQNYNLFNQQQKSEIIKLFEKECPAGFSINNPTINNGKWALIIDGGQLLEIRPLKTNGTVFDYAKQLLLNNIIPEFRIYDRIDIVFDSDQSQVAKSFIRRHDYKNKKQQPQYDLRQNDILQSSQFYEFVHNNRAKLASVIRYCWSQDDLIDLLPVFKHLVIAGPQQETVKLTNNLNLSFAPASEILHNLESDHIEADTRLFLHVYDIQMDNDGGGFDGIVIQSSDTDVLILSIAHIQMMKLPNYFIKKFNTSTKLSTFINIKEIEKLIKTKWNINDLSVLLVLHAISGCDTTSFTRNITKVNYFITFLSDPDQFQDLFKFGNDGQIILESLQAAEDLLVSCYRNSRRTTSTISTTTLSSSSSSSTTTNASLDSLRAVMAFKQVKNKISDVCLKLPPSSNSFHQHCRRAWRQVFIWKTAFESLNLISCYSIEDYGYQRADDGELVIRWMTIPAVPTDISLSKCVTCKTGCRRCTCSKNNLLCTSVCGCSPKECKNRESIPMTRRSTTTTTTKPTPSFNDKSSFDDDYDEDKDDGENDNDEYEDEDKDDGEHDNDEYEDEDEDDENVF